MHQRMGSSLAAPARAGPPEPDRGRDVWGPAPWPPASWQCIPSRPEMSQMLSGRVLREAVELLQEGRGGARLL